MANLKNIKIIPPQNRLVGDVPKIGIRPVIDGRLQGVRESLEDQTMAMAKTAAEFLTTNLRHANGLPVECVIADTCIGGVTEAAQTAEKYAREGVGVSLTVTPCWCYGSETMDMDPYIPKAVWGFNGTERPGAVYLAAVGGAGALISKSIEESEVIAYPELGPEAIRKVKVKDFPCIVINDMYGGDLYQEGKKEFQIE